MQFLCRSKQFTPARCGNFHAASEVEGAKPKVRQGNNWTAFNWIVFNWTAFNWTAFNWTAGMLYWEALSQLPKSIEILPNPAESVVQLKAVQLNAVQLYVSGDSVSAVQLNAVQLNPVQLNLGGIHQSRNITT